MQYLTRILGTARVLWPFYLGIVVCSVGTAAAALVSPFLIRDATDAIVGALGAGGDRAGAARTVVALALGLLAADLVQAVVQNIGGYLGDVMAARMREILATRYFAKLLALPQRYFDDQRTGTMIARLDRSITNVIQFLQAFANTFFPMLLTMAAVLAITAWHWWPLAVLLAVVFPVYVWLTALTSRRWQRLERAKNHEIDHAGGRFAEAVGQIQVVRSFVAELRELRAFAGRYARTVGLTRVQSRWWHGMDATRGAALTLIFFGIHLLLFTRTLGGHFSIGTMVMLIQLTTMAKHPVTMMSYVIDTAQRAVAGSRDYFDVMVLDAEPAADPRLRAAAARDGGGRDAAEAGEDAPAPGRRLEPVPGAPVIEFDAVDFAYEPGTPVLRGVSFTAEADHRVALVGESGGGKSTIVQLLLGFYRPTGGRLRICGRDVTGLPMADLRATVGVVFQDAALFSGTIRENIAYGRPGAGEAEIRAAAERANADGFIRAFAEGYDTVIGERGLKLSGGQRQRIAIARAILKDAPVLILDEATSALDTRAEREVQRGLEELMAGRTTIVIAHRLSTISGVDRVVTLDRGRVDEVGSPAELAGTGGIYAELLRLTASASAEDRRRLSRFGLAPGGEG
ncbi:iron ABC transporter ATP-binding protein [Corynebacterium sphenisci DSM 44792]|uniref:Iron ABC transporter ATP-binding protein n=1 Tax=Corynebacterium sphenisci DSM 44792 TaxID=1437874 RepID=A0A1L7CZ25_9CORY|nr:ABC transporter ATP-binding protein [Corynebacterium sphenisci]APT91084.1 iron ABC transporter ATP-binding protein [Corynebacterium sphenisci DSM 44792]